MKQSSMRGTGATLLASKVEESKAMGAGASRNEGRSQATARTRVLILDSVSNLDDPGSGSHPETPGGSAGQRGP